MWRSVLGLHVLILFLAPAKSMAEARSSVTVGSPIHISSLEPAQDGFVFQRMQVGETLVEYDQDGNAVPGLATSWRADPDGLVWHFSIREGVRFHDGSLLDAAAAATSLERARAKPSPLRNSPIESIAVAGSEVIIKLRQRFAALPAVLSNYASIVLAPGSYDTQGKVVALIGTGPFKVVEFSPPLTLKVRKFPQYWGPAPAIMEARYLSNHRAEARALMVESGDNDLAFTLDPAGFSRLKQSKTAKALAIAIPRSIVIKLNLARAPLADVDARRALSLALDRRGIASGILRFPDMAATQLFPPIVKSWHDPALPPLAMNTAEAQRLLAGLGWKAGSDGVLTRNGQRFSLTLRTFPNRPELPLIAAAVQDQWRALGVELKVSVGNPADIPAGHKDGSMDVGLYARNYSLTPDPVVNALEDFGVNGGDWGAMNWAAPAVAAALQTASTTDDQVVRAQAIKVIASALQGELPVIPIAWYNLTAAHSTKLEGIQLDPFERSFGLSRVRWLP